MKAAGCVLIVLHHLAFYGPMSDHADDLFPGVFDWAAQHARLAVQMFLVLAGYLAARGLFGGRDQALPVAAWGWRQAMARVIERFVRLALPLWAALVLAVACNALADHWIDHPSISAWPTLMQVLVHALLLQDLAGHEALSAGIWYVAIDFQLYAMLTVMAAVAQPMSSPRAGLLVLVLAGIALSAMVINRLPAWDVVAPYFWCSYGLGVVLALGPRRHEMMAAAALVFLAWALEPRSRLLVALASAAALWVWLETKGRVLPHVWPWCRGLSRISYSVFLIHFPVCLVVNALWTRFLEPQPLLQLVGVVTAFKLSLVAGWAFHEWVERPLVTWAQACLSKSAFTRRQPPTGTSA